MRLVVAACVAGVAGLLGCSGGDDAGGRGECAEPLVRCEGRCVDPSVDAAHCGGCGVACGEGTACLDAACVALRCEQGLTSCDHGCVELASDPAHCGACGNACPEGQACADGACACPQGAASCDGVCVDLQADAANCGGCGNACDGGERCLHGGCLPAACEGTLLLPGPPEVALGGPVHDVALADWDGDGDLDLIAALVSPAEVRVLANRGDGSFQALGPIVGLASGELAVADLDADGDLDVAVVDPARPDRLSTATRSATGGFAIAERPLAAPVTEFLVAELDGRAPPETVYAQADGVRIEWGGSEAEARAGFDAPRGLRVGDLDGDGDGDVVGVEGDGILVLLVDRTPASLGLGGVALGFAPGELELGDLDGDGDLDLVGSAGVLLRNRGDGTFDEWPAELPSAAGVEIADLDGDGRLDLLFAGPELRVFRGTGGGFAPAGEAPLAPGTATITAATLDGDGTPDVLAVDPAGHAALLPGRGDGTFPSRFRLERAGARPRLGIANVVDGGAGEVFLAFGDDPKIRIYRLSQWGLVESASVNVGHGVEDLALGDTDGDGWADLFAIDREGDAVTLALSNPHAGFETPTRIEVGDGPTRLALADVDGDGYRDLAVVEAGARALRVIRNHAWTTPAVVGLDDEPHDVAAGDVDGDGAADFAIALGQRIALVRGDGRGNLAEPVAIDVNARAVAVADLDGDGAAEVVAVNGAGVTVLRSAGGGLEAAGSFALDGGLAVAAADLDLDGDRDVLVLLEDGRVELLRRSGDGALESVGRWAALGSPISDAGAADLALGDGDRDGWVEPIVAGEGELGWLVPGCAAAP